MVTGDRPWSRKFFVSRRVEVRWEHEVQSLPPVEKPLDILVIAAHPDDAEISIGGTIISCLEKGLRVGVLELTSGEPTPHGSLETRQAETAAASAAMNLTWRGNLDLPNRQLLPSLDARHALAGLLRLLRPQIILTHYWEDAHPDHVAASQLTDAARFWAKLSRSDLACEPFHPTQIYYYWSIHLRNHPQPAFVFDVSRQFEQKMKAVRCYESQLLTGRSTQFPTVLDDIRDRARYWGWSIGTSYGEPFASRETIGIGEFAGLKVK